MRFNNKGRITGGWKNFVKTTFLGVAAILFVLHAYSFSYAAVKKRVLLVSSYHPAFPTFFQQIDGIKDRFSGEDIYLDIEFMDSKRFPGSVSRGQFIELLASKLSRTEPYDAVMTADDNALVFALEQQKNLFKDTPIVFFGINNRLLAQQQNDNPLVTGIVEAVSMKDTIELISRLQPETKKVIAIVDGTPSGQGDLTKFHQIAEHVDTVELSEISLTRLTWQELAKTLQNVSSDSALLLLSAYKDKNNVTMEFQDSLNFIKDHRAGSIYHLWYHGIGSGVVGGKVISQYEQGNVAAKVVLNVLNGAAVEQITVTEDSPNRYVFDFHLLQKYQIPISRLPAESIVLNQPSSFYKEFKHIIWGITCGFVVLLLALFFSMLNIVRRKNVERQLRAGEEKYRSLIEGTSDAVISIDSHGSVVSWNTGATNMFGFSPGEIVGKHIGAITPKELRGQQRKMLEKVRATDDHQRYKTFRLTKDGTKVPVDILLHRKCDADGTVIGTSAFIRDITEQHNIEKALRASEMKFSKAFQSAPLLMTISAVEDGVYLDVNDAFTQTTGYRREKAIGTSSVELGFINVQARDQIKQEMINKGYVHDLELELKKADGSGLCCLYSGEFIEVGGTNRLLSIATDITARRKLEKDLLQSQKMEAIGTLAGGIAHDFNNILAAMIGYTEIALEERHPAANRARHLNKVLDAGERAKGLVRQILTFSRQSSTEKVRIQSADRVQEALKILRPSLPSTIEISTDIDPEAGVLFMGATQLNQIVMNLCTNAFHAMEKKGGKLSVSLKRATVDSTGYVQLSVSDTGAGIDPGTKKRIFEPYFTTKETGKGTGMGLAIVHGLVTSYKGFVSIDSELGKGTTVHVYLPASQGRVDGNSEAVCAVPTGNESILFVDDEELITTMGKTMLERLGYRVTASTSSCEALETFRNEPDQFDLVITDQTMPKITGVELAQRMMQIRPDIPIILCTGYSAITSETEAKLLGIKAFAYKPLVKKQLAGLLRSVLDS